MTKKIKTGFVTIAGKPNAGKSTLLNSLLEKKLVITSPKPQTTRHKITGILNSEDYQIVFIDTPGIFKTRHLLDKSMANSIMSSLDRISVLLMVIDLKKFDFKKDSILSGFIGKISPQTQVILVLNKIDIVNQEFLIKSIEFIDMNYKYNDIVPVSAKKGFNIDELLKVILNNLPYGEKIYDEFVETDSTDYFLFSELIREKIIEFTKQELPYSAACQVNEINYKSRVVYVQADIIIERVSQKGIIIGKKGSMLKKIGEAARSEIEKKVKKKVYLDISVRVKKDWRTDEKFLRELGYLK